MTGRTSLNMGVYQVDPVTGDQVELTPGQRATGIVGGAVQLVLVVVGVTAAGQTVRAEFRIASNQIGPGGGLQLATTEGMALSGAPTLTLGGTGSGVTAGAVTGTLGVASPVVLYMTSTPGGLGGSGRPTTADIAANMEPEHIFDHGDPDTWKYLGEKRGSGVPADSPVAPPGTLKIFEVWEDEFGALLEVHYFRHLDGSVSNVLLDTFTG